MVEKNPVITLDDDGKHYWFGGSPLIQKLENIDICTWQSCTESGEVRQDKNSINRSRYTGYTCSCSERKYLGRNR